ncbi:hypothetical protein BGW80DRAFT_1347120 [Lactifluus volemus]|nr:hypothetical protein BGW80DRAFT_1347120 [Lactifluus volemus]
MSPTHRVHGWLLEPHLHLAQAAPSLVLLSSFRRNDSNVMPVDHGSCFPALFVLAKTLRAVASTRTSLLNSSTVYVQS